MKNSSVAVFIDVENIHYSTLNNYSETPDWSRLVDLCKEHGRLASIQAFGDWINFSKEVHEIQKNGIQPIFVPLSQDGKSSLDCYLTVAAMKLFFQNDTIDTLILASGDRDYIPLIAELKAQGKTVIILAVPHTLSKDLVTIVDDIISYTPRQDSDSLVKTPDKQDTESAKNFVVTTLKALESRSINDRWVNLAVIGLALKNIDSSFSHVHFGYIKLVEMLDDIKQIEIKYDNHEKTTAVARTVLDSNATTHKETILGSVDNIKEGYGFIKPDDNAGNIFFHSSKVIIGHFEDLKIGDRVSFNMYHTERGLNAENVTKV